MNRSTDRIVAIFFAILGAYVVVESHARLPYQAEYGPGPGFLPILLGIGMIFASASLLFQTFIGPSHEKKSDMATADTFRGTARVGSAFLLFAASVLLFENAGFFISFGLLVFSLTYFVERGRLPLKTIVGIALLMPIAFISVFKLLLNVALPGGPFGL